MYWKINFKKDTTNSNFETEIFSIEGVIFLGKIANLKIQLAQQHLPLECLVFELDEPVLHLRAGASLILQVSLNAFSDLLGLSTFSFQNHLQLGHGSTCHQVLIYLILHLIGHCQICVIQFFRPRCSLKCIILFAF